MIKFNWDYFYPVFKEGEYMKKTVHRIRRVPCSNNKVLIIVPCLVGDFIATVPAIYSYITTHNDKQVDLMVTPPLRVVAEKIRGVGRVYAARSVAERQEEGSDDDLRTHAIYEEIIILRASKDVFHKARHLAAERVLTVRWKVFTYGLKELVWNIIVRKRPRQWRDFSFDLLEVPDMGASFEEMFVLEGFEFEHIASLRSLHPGRKTIIVHTGASWPMMKWELAKWAELIRRIHAETPHNFIFIGSAKDKGDFEYIAAHVPFHVFSCIGEIDLWTLTRLLHKADRFIGIDSGPGNIAHLVDLRSMILYGPGPHTFMPHDARDIIIDKSRGRGLIQRFFILSRGFIHSITVEEAFLHFKRLL